MESSSSGPNRRAVLGGLAALLFLSSPFLSISAGAQTAPDDPLPSWNDGPAKAAIIDLVKSTTNTASPCTEEITRLEQRLRDAKTNPADQPTGKQTVDAQLGYQATPKSIAEAELRADEAVQNILDRAKAFDAENKTSECEAAVAEAKLHFGP